MESKLFTVFRHGDDALAAYDPPEDAYEEPRLRLDGVGMAVWIRPSYYRFEGLSAGHVEFARQLVEASQEYLAELERAFEHDQSMEDAA